MAKAKTTTGATARKAPSVRARKGAPAVEPASPAPDPIATARVAELEQRAAAAELRAHVAEDALAIARKGIDAGWDAPVVDPKRLAELEEQNRELHKKLDALPSRRAPAAPGTLRCPRCGEAMEEIDHRGVLIDRCSGCEGLYFDAGELETVIRHEYPEPQSPEHAADPKKKSFFRSLFKR